MVSLFVLEMISYTYTFMCEPHLKIMFYLFLMIPKGSKKIQPLLSCRMVLYFTVYPTVLLWIWKLEVASRHKEIEREERMERRKKIGETNNLGDYIFLYLEDSKRILKDSLNKLPWLACITRYSWENVGHEFRWMEIFCCHACIVGPWVVAGFSRLKIKDLLYHFG